MSKSCFLNQQRVCDPTCMAYCGTVDANGQPAAEKSGKVIPQCTFIQSMAVMGSVSSFALADVLAKEKQKQSRVNHPPSAPPPPVQGTPLGTPGVSS